MQNLVQSIALQAVACGIRIDMTRQQISPEGLAKLLSRFGEKLMIAHRRMMLGEIVNQSENRAALHSLLRASSSKLPHFGNVASERHRILNFADNIHYGKLRGCRGHCITDIINIGIGGSETGVKTIWHALRLPSPKIRVHFLASVDGITLERTLAECLPFSTLVVVSSKSFTTRETMVNAAAVDQWLMEAGIIGNDRSKHMVVVSSKSDAAQLMCLPEDNLFKMWDWVGGRFSVWGAVGLPLAIALGTDAFQELLKGAEEMDKSSVTAPIEQNLPALLALVAYYNSTKLRIPSHCILPYDERLREFVPWVQQLEMESLGKPGNGPTGQCIWGYSGNEGQHSFYQWLREGTGNTSIDLIWTEMPGHKHAGHYATLLSNAKAQAEALVHRDASSKYFNVLTTIAIDDVTPRRLGALMAMYEHKTTMLATLYGINAFDQPGVELGKQISRSIETQLA